MTSHPLLDPECVRALARYADLPLSADRESAVAQILAAWIPEANALSRKMSAPEYQSLTPGTIFSHPIDPEGEG
jgi:hypothetical protein